MSGTKVHGCGGIGVLIERMKKWQHAFKLDPNRALSDTALERICRSGTDVVIVGGTDGITYENSRRLIDRISAFPIDCVQEVSSAEAVVPGLEGYLLPTVLNVDDSRWLIGAQHQAVKAFGDWIPWEDTAGVGYIVLNPDSRVARLTKSRTDLTLTDIIAYTRLADHLFHLPALYIEYSGMLGDPAMVRAAQGAAEGIHLFYGGGISGPEEARTMAAWADTVVIGNLAHRNVDAALATVEAVKESREQTG